MVRLMSGKRVFWGVEEGCSPTPKSDANQQVECGLHVAPAALDLEQLLVAERDVLGAQRRV
jgi:hypothetical protein